jgi:serine/threonine-protein phosphatase PP1 catalytic subunit
MGIYRGKIVELPKKGHAIIVTDIHGNLTDYNKYLELWKKYGEKFSMPPWRKKHKNR